jgi:rfaE bifunctional protein nucleotidyltransferase chain/domain
VKPEERELAQVVSQDNLMLLRQGWKNNGQCVVFVGGCFDLLHPGHIRLLEQARSHGDILVVGVQSDDRVRARLASKTVSSDTPHKVAGHSHPNSRPVTPAAERAEILASLAAVDYVVEYDDALPDPLIARLAPDILVEGGSPTPGAPPSSPENRSAGQPSGTKLVRVLLEPGFSTERLIERIRQVSA